MPTTTPPPADLVEVVNGLARSNAEVVTLDDLASFNTGRDPLQVVRALRGRGWLHSIPVNGAWESLHRTFLLPTWPVFTTLRARLRTRLATRPPASGGGRPLRSVTGYAALPPPPLDTGVTGIHLDA